MFGNNNTFQQTTKLIGFKQISMGIGPQLWEICLDLTRSQSNQYMWSMF